MRNSAIRKGKIRLLAGIMASLLMAAACMSGVKAAGTEDHTALHASDGRWNATAGAGETPFPEGAVLNIAADRGASVSEVQGSIEDTDSGDAVLRSLNVYEISLTDGGGEPLDYDDEITLTVTDEDAVQQEPDDEISCVVYPVTEAENGLSAGEPQTADEVKLSDTGELAEFTVTTSLTGRIAAAVYTVSDDETQEEKPDPNALVLDSAGTEENQYTDNGISTFAVNPEGNDHITLPELKEINKDTYSPLNNLQIVDNIDGARVELLNVEELVNGGTIDRYDYVDEENEGTKKPNDSLYSGVYDGVWWGPDRQPGIDQYMYASMWGEKKYGGVSVLFPGSGVDYEIDGDGTYMLNGQSYNINTNPDDHYRNNYEAGWKSDDLSIAKTSMKVTLRYTNAGYYKGRLIDAIAVISITPSKNKNQSTNDRPDVQGYHGIYSPMFQASGSLYRGWVWQNVEQFHVDLTFYKKGSDTPIELGMSNASSAGNNQSIDAMNADYYVINSLNPASETSVAGKPTIYVGPEYVLPTHDIANAYKVGEYIGSDETSYSSNIQEEYTDSGQPIQYAYNGGTTAWDSDDGNKPGWAQNSVMIMPKEETTTLGFTMGNMSRIPPISDTTATQATNLMWASISTTPYTKEYQPINIDVEKTWQGITDLRDIKSIDLKLYGEYLDAATQKTVELDLDRQITITREGGWKGTFDFVPGEDFLRENGYNNNFRYIVKETKITYDNREPETPEEAGFVLVGTTEIPLISINGDSGTIDQKFKLTNIMPGITIIKKGIVSDGTETFLEGVEFQLQQANDEWKPVQGGLKSKTTDNSGKVVFSGLKEGNYLLTETKTRQGYTLLKEPVKVTIPYVMDTGAASGGTEPDTVDGVTDSDGKTYYYNLTYTITNGQSFDLPQTGGTSADGIMRTGMVLFATATGALLYLNRKRRREQQKR